MKTKTLIITIAVIALPFAGAMWLSTNDGGSPNAGAKELISVQAISHGHGLAVDPNDASKLYIATHYGLFLLEDEQNLYQVGNTRDDYMGFSPHPTDSSVFFSSGHPARGGNIGFQKSEDGGFTWKKISNGLGGPVDFHAMAVSPADPNVIYGWYQGNLQTSKDSGATWEKYRTDFPVVHFAADTKGPQMLYASSPQGFFKSIDGGATWQQLFNGFVATSVVNPSDQSILSVSEKYGLARSVDGGTTWTAITERFNGETPLYISHYRQNPDIAYLLTEKNNVYKSTDGGDTWQKLSVLSGGKHDE
ncbi:hypothetical protein A3H74_04215 [Candidatus Kaiserbacteria bacterium RIFCSPLOWO2_02_FULL_51_13]|uniref:Sortilin N-terminal domain-containing protein n=1 Tax=Candidatus Kaiserbacteria bacterium RIFCSPLOWO2_01_FULL_50_24 TaxID=1798507 RepID=A0A1F6EMZ5_9BACT|nr:MAG: hypothetical protein A3A34_02665 [Candidatus Kaiserbacteria bacterium RIFCSPLOWO2_01_FULL_50_24]OGG82049.1 MAG: hypothetical protein A3H74_04215 [Candidatus Kaiserbacteria bacterium RIFCSPLOWO2_02_FULL_51_13]